MFTPPRCPNDSCPAHKNPKPGFYISLGSYQPKCRPHPVPRFRCRICRRGFSRQTFRADYRDRKPHLNPVVLGMLSSGMGLRQFAREFDITRPNLAAKMRKIAAHTGHLHRNLTGSFREGTEFAMDELETFEGCRSLRPVTVPILIEQDSFFVTAVDVGTLRPSGKMTPERLERIREADEAVGRRENESSKACSSVLEFAAERCRSLSRLYFRTDMKKTYSGLIRRAFAPCEVDHRQTHSRRQRNPSNPLHRINLMLAISRDLMGRLRRRSWLVSKCRHWLKRHLALFTVYRNYHRPRFNGEDKTPAMLLGFTGRPLTKGEILGWRQDWGPELSPDPAGSTGAAPTRSRAPVISPEVDSPASPDPVAIE